jgi:hypothetical protein
MIRWFAYLIVYLIVWALNWFIAPVYSLFTAKGWPTWGKWLITPDNVSCGDRQYMREGAPFVGIGHKGIKSWINRTFWLYRNPLVGFAVDVLGYKRSDDDRMIAVGNPRVGDKRKVEGLFSQYVYRDGKLVAFQHYYIKRLAKDKCFRARIGWKLSSWPYPKMSDKFAFVCAITPWKAWG